MALAAAPATAATPSVEELSRLSIEDLLKVEVTSVSKRAEPLSRAPAAIYVITSEDIRRSGAVSLAEALRLAPNLYVAQRDAFTYAISARGFNSFEAANKLLVLIDGRSLYTPLHGGVFWDQQQLPLADVERIEVISGPGGTLWGANAFNGVINIITRHTADTQGGLLDLRGGTDSSAVGRYGGKLGDVGTYRAYGLGFERRESYRTDGSRAGDDWFGKQGGFRTDLDVGSSKVTFQGDAFETEIPGGTNVGWNLLGRLSHAFAGGSRLEVQAYYDTVDREAGGVTDTLDTFDVQMQHAFRVGARHQLVWGGGHRVTKDSFISPPGTLFVLDPESDTVQLSNLFVQDSIALTDALTLTAGTKFEYSSYSGFEYLPSVRVGWAVTDDAFVWAAVSRAVRTPTRIDRDLAAAGLVLAAKDFRSETVVAYEVGVRGRPIADLDVSLSLFFNDYSDLRALTLLPSGQYMFGNALEGHTYGAELWGTYFARSWWRLSAGLTTLHKDLDLKPGGVEASFDQHRGNDPEYQVQFRSSMNVTSEVEFDVGLRAIDDLPAPMVPGYVEAEARLAWKVAPGVELSVAGFNLLDHRHPELGAPATRRELGRTVYAGARWRF
ncbi:MAG: TonB-dependent receptor plug domain-containing protein [Rhodospirillaceae bacterium]